MSAPTITALPAAPLRSQSPANFTTTAENFVDALADLPTEINAFGSYLDGLSIEGSSWKMAVRVATTAAGTLASGFENGDTIDGVVLATGDRILIKDQSSGAENGIYVVAASGAPTRATGFDNASEVPGALVYVMAGSTNGGTIWRNTNTSAPTIGTTALTFAQFTGGGYAPGGTDVAVADGGTGASTAAGARTNLGLVIGTDVQAYSALLAALAAAAAADIWTGTNTSKFVTPKSIFDSAAVQTLTDGATITPDFGAGLNFKVTLGGNRTLANPTNAKDGQSGVIRVTQDGTGSRTLAYGSNWRFPGGSATGGVLSTTAGAVDQIAYIVGSGGLIYATLSKAFAA